MRRPLWSSRKHLLVILSIVLIAITGSSLRGSVSDRAGASPLVPLYSCGGDGYDNCHGIVGWEGGSYGGITTVRVREMTQTGTSPNNFIRNKLWLAGGCCTGGGFLEVGYGTRYVSGSGQHNEYFWATQHQGSSYDYTSFDDVSSQELGGYTFLAIGRVAGTNNYRIDVSRGVNPDYYDYDYNHAMSPYYIVIGTQLSGSGGANMDDGYAITWGDNARLDSSWDPTFQTVDNAPSTVRPGPIDSEWIFWPSESETGGLFTTLCCATDSQPSRLAPEPTPPWLYTEPRTYGVPKGVAAISPTILNTSVSGAGFTRQDVENYVNRDLESNGGAGMIEHVDPFHRPTLTTIDFLVHKDLLARYDHLKRLRQADDTLLCYVELSGIFNMPGSPVSEGETGCTKAYSIYDATTGNQLRYGVFGCGK